MNDPAPGISTAEREQRSAMALDQWRGFALVLVLISHGFFFTDRVNGIGRVGVNLFFFISGILVFRTLTRSRSKTGWERTKSFWWRRFRRLYPALLVYLALILPAMWWLQRLPNLPAGSEFRSCLVNVWMPLLYVSNYHTAPGPPMPFGHLWSLGCEMQFYLVAPLIFLAGGVTGGRRMTVYGLLLLIFLGLGVAEPLVTKSIRPGSWAYMMTWKYHFEFAVWPMMAGFFCEYRRDWFSRLSEGAVKAILGLSLMVAGISLALMLFGAETKLLVIGVGGLLLLPCLLAYLYGRPLMGWPGACLRWLGERTYSIYLWQQPLTICRFLPNMLHPLGAVVSIALGAISFRYFEYPFLSVNRQKQESKR